MDKEKDANKSPRRSLEMGVGNENEDEVPVPVNAENVESKLQNSKLIKQGEEVKLKDVAQAHAQVQDGNEKSNTSNSNSQRICAPCFPELVIQNVFKYLSSLALLNCRVVSRGWWMEATGEMKKHPLTCVKLKNLSPFTNPKMTDKSSLMRFNDLMQCSNYLPYISYSLTVAKKINQNDTSEFFQFFQTCGLAIQNLRIHPRDLCDTTFNFLEVNQLENLENLEMDFSFTSKANDDDNWEGSLVRNVLQAAPNIQSIIYATPIWNKTCELFEAFDVYPPLHLNSLTANIWMMTEGMLNSMAQLNLKCLSLKMMHTDVQPDAMKTFLASQSQSLEYLKLLPHCVDTKLYYDFPTMAKLKTLSIEFSEFCSNWLHRKIPVAGEVYEADLVLEPLGTQTLRFTLVDWPKCFPKLEELKIRKDIELHWKKALFSSTSHVHYNLKTLTIPHSRLLCPFSRLRTAQEICRIFPNIETLNAPWFDENTLELCDLMPNLKTYVATTYPNFQEEVIECYLNQEEVQCNSWKATLKNLFLDKILPNAEMTEFVLEKLTNFRLELKFRPPSGSTFQTIRRSYDANWLKKLFAERKRKEQEKRDFIKYATVMTRLDSDEEESDDDSDYD